MSVRSDESAPCAAGGSVKRVVHETAYVAVCVLIAIAASWPLLRVFTTRICGDPGDPYQTIWGMRWIHDALWSFRNPFFSNRVFYPTGATLVFQTFDLPSAIAVAPLWGWLSEVAVYNAAILLALTLTAYGMFRLVRELTGDALVGLAAGAIFTAVPYEFAHLEGHLHLLAMGWLPLYLVYLLRVVHGRGTRVDGVLAGLFLALASLASWYHLLYALVLTPVLVAYGFTTDRHALLSATTVRASLALVATWLALVGPLLAAILVTRAREELTGAHDELNFSADLYGFVFPNAAQSWSGAFGGHFRNWSGNATENATYVGVTVLALALAGAAGNATARAFLIAAVLGAVLALGPRLHVDGRILPVTLPYRYLERALPVLTLTGVPVRFGYVMYLGLVTAAGYGLARLRTMAARLGRPLGVAAVIVPLALALWEYRPRALITSDGTAPAPMRAWANDAGDWAVLDVSDYYLSMWHATIHRKPMVGGYLTRVPKRLDDAFHSHPVIRAILEGGYTHSVDRTDPRIDFTWGEGSPDATLMPDAFQAHWEGMLRVAASGSYELWLGADDAAELWLDGRALLRRAGPCPAAGECAAQATIELTAGEHPIAVSFVETTGNAEIHLWWRPPGGARTIVPTEVLQTAAGTPGLDVEYEQRVRPVSGFGTSGGRAALRALDVRYVVTWPRPNACIEQELQLPLSYEGDGVRIYEVPPP